jgi:hypothetical protein
MHTCVPIESLTKTFVDAIEIARTVGLQYIWIDSLCIIQDSYHDWEVEAASMTSVYGGSSFNTAASSAENGTQGCFPRPWDHYSEGFQAEVRINGRKEVHHLISPTCYASCIHHNHLGSRAWAIQEKVLSPRTLHCGDRGMFWECRTTMASDDLPDGFDSSGAGSFISSHSVLLHPDRTNSFNWPWLVAWYSRRELTYPKDKLVALAGVARLLTDRVGDQYLAGLWRKDLEVNPCWKVLYTRQRPPYRAPSWSWAAVNGMIVGLTDANYDFSERILHIRVHSVSVQNTGADPCGSVAHGILTLDCDMIRKGTVRRPQSGSALTGPVAQGEPPPLFADLGCEKTLFPFALDLDEEQDERLGQIIYFLPLRTVNCRHGRTVAEHSQVITMWDRHRRG